MNVERGRTVPNWRPRRLGGGGHGTTRVGGEDINQQFSERKLAWFILFALYNLTTFVVLCVG